MSALSQQLQKIVPERMRSIVDGAQKRLVVNPLRIGWQVGRLLKSPRLNKSQRELMKQASMRIHHRDEMYIGDAAHYFMVGLSAIACIDDVLDQVPMTSIKSVLDLPSGYGRELRFLVRRFPDASITACDIQWDAVDFCAAALGALPAYSRPEFREMNFDRKFDLIWSGSLVTHLDRQTNLELFKLFSRHLNPGGLMIFTTHGELVVERMRTGTMYGLPAAAIRQLVESYAASGYAFCDYARAREGDFESAPEEAGYGLSLTSPETVRALAAAAGNLEEVYFKPKGWDDHQDVFAYRTGLQE